MDFIDELRQFSKRAQALVNDIKNEEATKTSLVLPFFKMLGYDIFNPMEFSPEFCADVGSRKYEKIDYSILKDGVPLVLIEVKPWSSALVLDKHVAQLFKYYGALSAKLAILTNGIVYRFYTDLRIQNKMDLTPFMEFDLFNIKESIVQELKMFKKESLDIDRITSVASDLRYSMEIKQYLKAQANEPTRAFLTPIIRSMYKGTLTEVVVDKFKKLYIKSYNEHLNEQMNERFQSAVAAGAQPPAKETSPPEPDGVLDEERPWVRTTDEETEAFTIIKTLVYHIIHPSRLSLRDTKNYIRIVVDGKVTNWLCLLYLNSGKKWLCFPGKGREMERYQIESNMDLFKNSHHITRFAEKFRDKTTII